MRLLIDTHAFLWYMAGDEKLSPTARALIDDRANHRLLSAAVPWEIAIKVSSGKITLDEPFDQIIPRLMQVNAIDLLPVTIAHASAVAVLPYPGSGHRDPFDRLMVAQCQAEAIPVISTDTQFDHYGVMRLW